MMMKTQLEMDGVADDVVPFIPLADTDFHLMGSPCEPATGEVRAIGRKEQRNDMKEH